MRKALGLTLQEISLMFVIVSFTAALLNPLGGILADRLGRKRSLFLLFSFTVQQEGWLEQRC